VVERLRTVALLVVAAGTGPAGCGEGDLPVGASEALITTPCVLHSGGGQCSHENGIRVSAACWLDAECVAVPGETHAGDGFVALSCEGSTCDCQQWPASEDEATTGDPALSVWTRFVVESPCASTDTTERVFRDRCLVGLRLALR
jgi:hypothetical protein